MNKEQKVSTYLEAANNTISDARMFLTDALIEMLGDNTHFFDKEIRPYITDEEECVRLGATKCTKDIVTLEDGSEMDISDIGTDDLHSIVDTIHSKFIES